MEWLYWINVIMFYIDIILKNVINVLVYIVQILIQIIVTLFSKINYSQLIFFFSSYVNSILFLIMMVTMLMHAKMGCETIVEDYVSSSALKKITIYALALVFYGAILSVLFSIVSILINN